MRELIDLFWVRYLQLRQAVDKADEQATLVLDREVETLITAIFEREATDPVEIQMQFLLVIELLKSEAEDESCVKRHTENLQRVVERHIMPGATHDLLPSLKEQINIAKTVPSDNDNDQTTLLDTTLLEGLSNRVAVVAPDYRYLFTNSVNASALDRAPEDMIGRHIGEFVGLHRFIQGLKERIDRSLAGEVVEYTYADRIGGRTVVTRCRISPYYSPTADMVGALLVMEEIADRRHSSAA